MISFSVHCKNRSTWYLKNVYFCWILCCACKFPILNRTLSISLLFLLPIYICIPLNCLQLPSGKVNSTVGGIVPEGSSILPLLANNTLPPFGEVLEMYIGDKYRTSCNGLSNEWVLVILVNLIPYWEEKLSWHMWRSFEVTRCQTMQTLQIQYIKGGNCLFNVVSCMYSTVPI